MYQFATRFVLVVCCFVRLNANAQLVENFSDGNFTTNPTWVLSNPSDWIVNSNLQLQSNSTTENSTFWISTANTQATTTEWNFFVQLNFNPSSTNLVDVYLTASAADLSATSTTGYVLRIGNTADEFALYRKDAGGAFIKIIDGADGVLNSSVNVMRIRVTRNAANQWNLLRDLTGSGTNFSSEGTVTDATYTTSNSFGFFVRQSTSNFLQRHFFDDIEIKTFVPDVTPPAVNSVTGISATTASVVFNETVDLTTSQNTANYTANNGLGNPISAVRNSSNTAQVDLTFATPFGNGVINQLTVNGVQDLSGNAISNGTGNFSFYTPVRYDVVITELLADPTPQVALPNAEWIEIRNTTNQAFNIQGWRVGDLSGVSGPLPSFILRPDSSIILCGTSATTQLQVYGRTFGLTSFPSLDNAGELIWIQNQNGVIIHSVEYNVSWYNNAVKADGGWTLELVDVKNPCAGSSNWKPSTDVRGGTPALKNSVDGINTDQTPPQVLRAFATDSVTINIWFNEPLDSLRGATRTNYQISNGIGNPISAVTLSPSFQRTQIKLGTPLQRNQVYTITVSNVTDCRGNTIGGFNAAKVGLAEKVDSFDIIINEVLFDPRESGADYVELYNRSNKLLNLKDLLLANRSSSGAVANFKNLSTDDVLIFPADYVAVTDNGTNVQQEYDVKNPAALFTISSMPSYNNDKSNVVLLNTQGSVVDELAYTDKWHFKLIDNKDGIALERINPNGVTQSENNWTSASKNSGYGTPTYQNSQFRQDLQVQGEVTVSPEVFSPDNDGFNDFLIINYQFPETGYVANITIFDAAGRPIRALQRNTLCGQSGSFRWDGLNDKFEKLPLGPYIIFTEIFNLQGKVKKFKNQVVLARRF
jgi:hypothetical protein